MGRRTPSFETLTEMEQHMNRKSLQPFATLVLALGIGLTGSIAIAQTAPTDQELQEFVAASKDVHRISMDSEASIKAAKSTEEAAKLDDEASDKMEAAVKKHGLTSERYTEIYTAMQNDDKVKARVAELAKK
jgi:hypothetical protein